MSIPVSYALVSMGNLVGYGAICFGAPVVACAFMVAGAVIGSGWKAKPADAVMTRPQYGVISPDTAKPQPGQSKCPFCQSTTFHVEEEIGLRRCSGCHSGLPNYIQGNR
jgi:hypothetical protein